MPRLTKLDDVLFPVDEYPVFVGITEKSGERRLTVPDKKALVNRSSGRVLGIVGRDYRLVSNQEALAHAFECCRLTFPDTKPVEWRVEVTDAPATGGHCYIDLVHNSAALDVRYVPAADKPDAFGPFIRVTNSYNGSRALAFDVGFFRKVCKNGMIVRSSIIRFKFIHSRRDIGSALRFEIDRMRLAEFRTSFGDRLAALRGCSVPRRDFERFVSGVLLIRRPEPLIPETRDAEAWADLRSHLHNLTQRYAQDLGENAYAVLNAITDFASRPLFNRCIRRDRHRLQQLAGSWFSTFSRQCGEQGFVLDRYLEGLGSTGAAPSALDYRNN